MPNAPMPMPKANNPPLPNLVRVTIVLTEPPTSRFYAALHADAVYSAATISQAVASQLERINQQQEELIKVVSAPPIGGSVVLRMQSALNAVVVTVDASHLPWLRSLTVVKGIYRDEIHGRDSSVSTSNASSK
ncbi:MAG: hypothetical protein KF716_24840 [Anaerolineae bacterium]|nr:hypothetical protein [Anaerolineae bacterium]